jgi:integrase
LSFASVKPKHWDTEKEKCLITSEWPQGRSINALLSKIMNATELVCLEALKEGKSYIWVKEQIQQKIDELIGIKTTKVQLLEAIDLYINTNPKGVKKGTMAKYTALKVKLVEYSKNYKQAIIYEAINYKFGEAFCRWMEEKGYLNDTIQKTISNLKTIMSWAFDTGYHSSIEFKKISVATSRNNDAVFLYPAELEKLYSTDFGLIKPNGQYKHWALHIATINNVRDVFCFACYTGQRYSDIRNLKWSDLVQNSDGWEWHIYQIKGNKRNKVIVPLNSKAVAIIWRQSKEHSYVFHTTSGQKYNDSIKEMSQLCGLDRSITTVRYSGKKRIEKVEPLYEVISSHKARSTFVTLLKTLKVSDKTIMEMTGHTDVRTMMRYEGVTNEAKRNAVSQAFENI